MKKTASVKPVILAPEAVAAINKAYLEACDLVVGESAYAELRTQLAEYMMYLARNGEHDPERLRDLSMHAVLGPKPQVANKGQVSL